MCEWNHCGCNLCGRSPILASCVWQKKRDKDNVWPKRNPGAFVACGVVCLSGYMYDSVKIGI